MTFLYCNYLKLLFFVEEKLYIYIYIYIYYLTLFQRTFFLPSKGLLLGFTFSMFLSE